MPQPRLTTLISRRAPRYAASFLLACLAGCGSVDPSTTNDGQSGAAGAPGTGRDDLLLPWTPGNRWSYRVTQDGVVTEKTQTVGDAEPVGGIGPHANVTAFRVTTAKGEELRDRTESWQAPDPDDPERIVRYRERAFSKSTGELELEEHWDPPKLRIDGSAERTVDGASWLESYSETKLEVGFPPTSHDMRERWTVLDDDATVVVPAGTFEHVIHFQKAGSGATKQYWYARGIGKLKETGGQTEELTGYELQDPR